MEACDSSGKKACVLLWYQARGMWSQAVRGAAWERPCCGVSFFVFVLFGKKGGGREGNLRVARLLSKKMWACEGVWWEWDCGIEMAYWLRSQAQEP